MTNTTMVSTLMLVMTAIPLLGGCNPATPRCTRTVSPGEGDDTAAVQAMFVAAGNGDTLCFAPGTYELSEALEIRDRTGVTIRGDGAAPGDVILDFFGQVTGAKGISATAMTDVTIENLSAIDAASDGVYVTGSTGVVLRDLRAGWVRRTGMAAGSYAIYPVNSTNVLVEGTETFGGPDSGIYVGQTTNCIVRGNEAHHNVAGIEIENSTNCEVYENTVEHNTGGILVFELPTLPMHGSTTSVHDNRVCSQDTPNFCHEGTTVCGVPDGVGIMLLAANRVEVFENEICGNGSTGILVISYATAVLAGLPEPMDPTFDPMIDDICLHDNTYPAPANGQTPAGPLQIVASLGMVTTLEDIVWDGLESGPGEFVVDETGSFRVAFVASSFADQSTDRTPYLGTCDPIPPVEL